MTTRDDRVAEILALLATGRRRHTNRPARLCELCAAALPVSGVGLALMTADGPTGVVLAATDQRARELEELQFTLGEGPCVDASRTGVPVLQPDIPTTGAVRWPGFSAAVLAAGVRAIFTFPLRVGAIRVGVLDLYRDTTGFLTATELADALAFADATTVMLLDLQYRAGAELARPIDSQAPVHQATGMISVRLGISLAEALRLLRADAYASGRTVSEMAAEVISRRTPRGGRAQGRR
jgi:hypothetical protein